MSNVVDRIFSRQPLVLDAHETHTFRRHLAFTLLDSAAAGILANALIIAKKWLSAADWHLNIPLGVSCIGMLAALHLGSAMATRPKKPFVVVPGLFFAASSLAMAGVSVSWLFLLICGIGAIFETATRPAITAIVRFNYQLSHRNHAMGRMRQAAALVFLGSTMGAAWLLDRAGADRMLMIRLQMVLAGLLSIAAYLCFRSIRVLEPPASEAAGPASESIFTTARAAVAVPYRDARFRNYLIGCILFAFCGLIYVSITPAFLSGNLGLSALGCTLLLHVIPSVASAVLTGRIGAWADHVGPWAAWVLIRIGWGLDPLLLALSGVAPSLAVIPLATMARVSRGSTMGGSWMLWWQTGVSYFAPGGEDTSRYMGIMTFYNGVVRLTAAAASSLFLIYQSRSTLLVVGGIGVLLSALHSLYFARREGSAAARPPAPSQIQ